MFGLDNQGRVIADYIAGHPGLKGRILFVEANPGPPEATFLGINTPNPEIEIRVWQGYLVRMRADTDTRQARTGDSNRRDTALASGAHFIRLITTHRMFAIQRVQSGRTIQSLSRDMFP